MQAAWSALLELKFDSDIFLILSTLSDNRWNKPVINDELNRLYTLKCLLCLALRYESGLNKVMYVIIYIKGLWEDEGSRPSVSTNYLIILMVYMIKEKEVWKPVKNLLKRTKSWIWFL